MVANLIRKIIPADVRPIRYISNNTYRATGGTVQQGPFKGMTCLKEAYFSSYIPKLLGSYEREIYPAVEAACAKNLELIVDVGAAEGYYAVGMAMRNPQAKVIAYEMAEPAQKMIAELSKLNKVSDRVEIRGIGTRESVQRDLSAVRSSLLICDCEGFELILLDPLRLPALRNTHVLVELHDFLVPGIAEEIIERFTPTHGVERIWQTDRPGSEYPYPTLYTRLLPKSYMEWAVGEWRPCKMSWLWMEPK